MFAISILSPGETLLFFSVVVGVLMYQWKSYTTKNPEMGTAVKKAAATTAIKLITRWLK